MPSATCRIAEPSWQQPEIVQPFANGIEHLLTEFYRLRLMLHREVLRLRAASLLTEDQFRGLYISDEQVDAVLRARVSTTAGQDGPRELPPGMQELSDQIQEAEDTIAARVHFSLAAGLPLPFHQLADKFSLGARERDVLLMCVAVEVDLQFETLYSYAQNDVTRKRPTPDLILRLLCETQEERLESRSIFSADGPLFHAPLVRFLEDAQYRDSALLARPLKAEERIVDFLLGQSGVDHRLRSFTTKMDSNRRLSSLQLPDQLLTELKNAARSLEKEGGGLFFHGGRGTGKRAAAEALSAEMNRPLLVADMQQVCTTELPLSTALLLLCRETVLEGANLHLAHVESLFSDASQQRQQKIAFGQGLRPIRFLLFAGSASPLPVTDIALHCRWLTFEFPVPTFSHRVQLWEKAVAVHGCGQAPDVNVTVLAGRYVLTGGEIEGACRGAKERASLRGTENTSVSTVDLEAAARSQSNQALQRLAQKVSPVCDWNDLVLPPRAMQQLREVCAAEKYRHVVYSQWGFDRRLAQGKGLNVLFCGPSGTGKTMAASILAQEFGLDLYKIDLSTVVSKYIGETEKQLSQIFREARSSNATLFFDEADALFGKRSEVKDAHDRYANIEVAYLLQKMEEFEGIVILATNFRKNMDDAFTRRMHHIVEFPLPDAEYRERIWRRVVAPGAPLAQDVDFVFLSRQFELAGGNIRNVVLAAAFLAAEESSPIRMEHFILATSRELQKLGRLPSRADFREYYELIRARG